MSYHSNVESRTLKIKCELEFEKEMIEFLWGHNTIPRIMRSVFFYCKGHQHSAVPLLVFAVVAFLFATVPVFACIGFLFCLQCSFFV